MELVNNEARRRVFNYLIANGPSQFVELEIGVCLSKDLISSCLKELEQGGIITEIDHNGITIYGIEEDTLLKLVAGELTLPFPILPQSVEE